jgi:hypothetical protein
MATKPPSKREDELDDIIAIDSGDAQAVPAVPQRKLVGMAGWYRLSPHADFSKGVKVFPCTIVKVSEMAVAFTGSIAGSVGEWAEVCFRHLGRFEGPILQVAKNSLVMRIVATQQERASLAAKLAWFADGNRVERRRFERFVPDVQHSVLSLSNGETMPCQLINYSAGGAAVYADVTPTTGTALKIAHVGAEVVRDFNGGFAVNFMTVQDQQAIETLLANRAA